MRLPTRSAAAVLAAVCATHCVGPASQAPARNGSETKVPPQPQPSDEASEDAVPADPVPPPTTKPASPDVNPFVGARMYVDPGYAELVQSSVAASPRHAEVMKKIGALPTAVWLDSIAAVGTAKQHLAAVSQQHRAEGKPVVPVFVVYDLPNRDCSAKSSAGELDVTRGGGARYRTEFIDPLAALFAANPNERIVVVLEPDSIGNLTTNLGSPKCAVAERVQKASLAYAISRLSMPNVHIYLDAAHAGWLGWDGAAGVARLYREILDAAGGADRIRGFVTNVSNYNTLHEKEGARLGPANPCPDEASYIRALARSLAKVGIEHKGFVVDTGRNGRAVRTKWGNWCNIRGAGLGERPRAAPEEGIDAYYWVKPPGASDGTSDDKAARYDDNCRSADALTDAPEAGAWFHAHFVDLVRRAQPSL